MNARQRYAIARPMARAAGSVAEFTREIRFGLVTLSTILTVNK